MVVRGPEFEQMLDISKPRAERCLGLPIEVLRPEPEEDLWVFKMSLLAKLQRPVLCLDTDLLFFDWDWSEFRWEMFNAALDLPLLKWNTGVRELNKYYDTRRGINGGMWYSPYNDEHLRVFHCAKNFILYESKSCKFALGDQTALNAALYRLQTPVHHLPYTFNFQTLKGQQFPSDLKVIHVIGDTVNTDNGKPRPDLKLLRFKKLAELKLK